jgi:hypothetical protein
MQFTKLPLFGVFPCSQKICPPATTPTSKSGWMHVPQSNIQPLPFFIEVDFEIHHEEWIRDFMRLIASEKSKALTTRVLFAHVVSTSARPILLNVPKFPDRDAGSRKSKIIRLGSVRFIPTNSKPNASKAADKYTSLVFIFVFSC